MDFYYVTVVLCFLGILILASYLLGRLHAHAGFRRGFRAGQKAARSNPGVRPRIRNTARLTFPAPALSRGTLYRSKLAA